MIEIAKYKKEIEELKKRVRSLLAETDVDYDLKSATDSKLKVVFAGGYSAGKSSILRALTGNDQIAIGAKITTDHVTSYDWKGIELIDTPGVHTGVRADHDRMSYEAIAEADLLVFVISNELFETHLAEPFKELAIDKDKGAEMILVVNKMGRTRLGNTVEQQEVIKEDLRRIVSPFTPEQLYISFIDAKYYLNGLEQQEQNAQKAQRLIAESGFEEFEHTLDRFIRDKNYWTRLTTELYELESQIQAAIDELKPRNVDVDIDAAENELRKKRRLLADARLRLQREVKGIYCEAAAEICKTGRQAADLFEEGCTKDSVEKQLNKMERKITELERSTQENVELIIQTRLEEVGAGIAAIDNGEVSHRIRVNLNAKMDTVPDNLKKTVADFAARATQVGNMISAHAYNDPNDKGNGLKNYSGSRLHQYVKDIGGLVEHKFKPWESVKITRGIATGAEVLSLAGMIINLWVDFQSTMEEKERENALKENRRNVIASFNEEADAFEQHGGKYLEEIIQKSLNEMIQSLDADIEEFTSDRIERGTTCKQLLKQQRQCRKLIKDIHHIQ